jgi:hypothetical protein
MSYTVSTLLLRNLHDVFGEIDPMRRRATIDAIFHEDAVFYDAKGGNYRVLDEIDRVAGVVRTSQPHVQYHLLSAPEVVGAGGGYVGWRAAVASHRLSPELISSSRLVGDGQIVGELDASGAEPARHCRRPEDRLRRRRISTLDSWEASKPADCRFPPRCCRP